MSLRRGVLQSVENQNRGVDKEDKMGEEAMEGIEGDDIECMIKNQPFNNDYSVDKQLGRLESLIILSFLPISGAYVSAVWCFFRCSDASRYPSTVGIGSTKTTLCRVPNLQLYEHSVLT